MRALSLRTGRTLHLLVSVGALALVPLAAACSDDGNVSLSEPNGTTEDATPTTDPLTTPSSTAERGYVVERAEDYIDIVVPHPATEQVIDGFEHFGTFVGTGHGHVFTYQRGTEETLEFLAVVLQETGVTTDAMLLTTNGEDVFLAASCSRKALVLRAGTYEQDYVPGVFGAIQYWTVGHSGRFVDPTDSDDAAVVEITRPTPLAPDVRYSTNTDREPMLRFMPDAFGWKASDSMACGAELGTLRLGHEFGWVYVVPTADIEVDTALEQLLDGRILDPEIAEATLAGLGDGRRVTGVLGSNVPFDLDQLLPYHRVIEDGVPTPMAVGDPVGVHIVDTGDGIVSVVLAPHGELGDLQDAAMPLLDTLVLVEGNHSTATGCSP